MHPSESDPRRNIEIKCRLASLSETRRLVEAIATDRLGVIRQTDTYFFTRTGRLKLREADPGGAQLVAYERGDAREARPSDYRLVSVIDPPGVKAALAETLGVQAVVAKTREVFIYHNVRIHLDDVAQLGEFLELEAIVGPTAGEAVCRERLQTLQQALRIGASDLVSVSYSNMIADRC
ncbi:MAG: class IV adenylate cyclase [Pirellulaceae bacterium]